MSNHTFPPPEWIDAPYIQNALRKGLNDPALSVDKVEIGPGSSVGENFAGQIFRVKVFMKNGTTMSVIAKAQPRTKMVEQLEVDGLVDIFKIEGLFFNNAVPSLEKLTDIHSVVPRPYHVDFDKKIILMEDLRATGFVLQPLGEYLNKDQAKLTIEALGKLHGASHILLKEDASFRKMFDRYVWNGERDEMASKFILNGIRSLEKWLDSYDLPGDYPQKLRDISKRLDKEWLKVCDRQEDRFNVLSHGDCWTNNTMYRKTGVRFEEVRILDFQVVSYNSFANDLHYFLSSSVEADVIINNLDYLLECYYNKVMETAPEIPDLTLSRIKEEFTERYFFGLVLLVVFRPCNGTADSINVDTIMEGGISDTGFSNPEYREDLLKLLQFLEKRGVF